MPLNDVLNTKKNTQTSKKKYTKIIRHEEYQLQNCIS